MVSEFRFLLKYHNRLTFVANTLKLYQEVSKMILLHKELIEKYKSDYEIKKLIQEGKIFKIEKGIYSDKKDVNYLEIISKKYPIFKTQLYKI